MCLPLPTVAQRLNDTVLRRLTSRGGTFRPDSTAVSLANAGDTAVFVSACSFVRAAGGAWNRDVSARRFSITLGKPGITGRASDPSR
jgi:hypothetical protein